MNEHSADSPSKRRDRRHARDTPKAANEPSPSNTHLPKQHATKQWECATLTCPNHVMTSQDLKETGRKIISDWFGRNKRATQNIPSSVWLWHCRKCYQVGRYDVKDRSGVVPEDYAKFYLRHIRQQLTCLRIWRPEARFGIQLQSSAMQRYMEHCRAEQQELSDGATSEPTASSPIALSPTLSEERKKGQSVMDRVKSLKMEHAKFLVDNVCGMNRSYADIEDTLSWMEELVERKEMTLLAPLEFLIHAQAENEPVTNPDMVFQIYKETCASTSSSQPEASTSVTGRKRKRTSSNNDQAYSTAYQAYGAGGPPQYQADKMIPGSAGANHHDFRASSSSVFSSSPQTSPCSVEPRNVASAATPTPTPDPLASIKMYVPPPPITRSPHSSLAGSRHRTCHVPPPPQAIEMPGYGATTSKRNATDAKAISRFSIGL